MEHAHTSRVTLENGASVTVKSVSDAYEKTYTFGVKSGKGETLVAITESELREVQASIELITPSKRWST